MGIDLGYLRPEIIEWAGFDVDQTLAPYPNAAYPKKFSEYTASRAAKLSPSAAKLNRDRLVSMAEQSYRQFGTVTKLFETVFGINQRQLYVAHHIDFVDEYLQSLTDQDMGVDEALALSILSLWRNGVTPFAFTNGAEHYGKNVVYRRGLAESFAAVRGVDSFDEGHLSFKNSRKVWIDLFTNLRIPSRSGYLYTPDSDVRKIEDWNYSNGVFFDDTPSTLMTLKEFFNVQTVFIQTDRVTPSQSELQAFDAVTTADNLWRFNFELAAAIEGVQSEPVSYPQLAIVR